MNISLQYELIIFQSELTFLDIDLDDDNPLFIDPRLIEISLDNYSTAMQKSIEAFWGHLIKLVRSKDNKGINYILSGMKEPNETKLGYAKNKKFGNSISKAIKPKLIEAIKSNKAVQSGILSHFGDLELFIDNIGSDRISDITTKIIKKVLIDYTINECKLHGIPVKQSLQEDIFNPLTKKWDKGFFNLPSYNGKPIIFVPKHLVRLESSANNNMSSFYRYAIKYFISKDKEMLVDISPSGKDGQLLLLDIKSKYPLSKLSMSNWMLKYNRMLIDFKNDVLISKIRPLTNDEICSIVYRNLLLKAS